MHFSVIFCFKQKTAYEMRISDGSSDVCSADLGRRRAAHARPRPADQELRRPPARGDRAPDEVRARQGRARVAHPRGATDRKSVVLGTSVSVRVDHGGRRIITKINTFKILINYLCTSLSTITKIYMLLLF